MKGKAMNNRRLLYLTLIVATLTIGVVIGTIVSGGVKATAEQKPATLVVPDPVSLSNAFSQIADQLAPAVVNISTEGTVEQPKRSGNGGGGGGGNRGNGRNQPPNIDPFDFFDFFGRGLPDAPDGGDFKTKSLGTGFIVDKAGYVLTNHHVVDKADKITVRLNDKSEFKAKVIGSDSETDLAVVKIDVGHDLAVAKMGNSDPVKVGDWVLAIGSPFGFDHSVTAGIISAKDRSSGVTGQQFQNFLQTDAAINPGNSGGPLVNMAGEVIGVNTAIISETRTFAGIGFALPSNTAIQIYNQLVQHGKVTRGSIGITYVADPDPSLFRAFGVKNNEGIVVQDVVPGKPAAKAGIRPGDIITEIDGKKITGPTVLLDVVANSPIGKTVQIRVNRDGREQNFPVTIGDREEVLAERASNNRDDRDNQGGGVETRLGLTVEPITPDAVRQLGLPSSDGVLITSVDRGSVAQEAGLAENMVITRMVAGSQRFEIKTIEDFRRAQQSLKPGTDVAFMVLVRDRRSNRYQSQFHSLTIP
jgi:serine protease Do